MNKNTHREIWLDDLGIFTDRQAAAIKANLEGQTFYRFHVLASNVAGTYTIGVEVDTPDTDEEVRAMFIYCAFANLRA